MSNRNISFWLFIDFDSVVRPIGSYKFDVWSWDTLTLSQEKGDISLMKVRNIFPQSLISDTHYGPSETRGILQFNESISVVRLYDNID